MSMGRYRGVNGVARKVTKRYRGVDGVAREIIKGYRGVDGVARQFFAAGIEWRKYSCDTGTDYTTTTSTRWITFDYYESIEACDSYAFNPSFLSGAKGKFYSDGSSRKKDYAYRILGSEYKYYYPGANFAAGSSILWDTMMDLSTAEWTYDEYEGEGYFEGTVTVYTPQAITVYTQGSTSYGSMYSPDGELPEDGTLVEGSADGDYCVINVGGTNYYYEKVG